MALAGRAALAPHGRDDDDAALLAVQHIRERRADRAYRPHQIDVQHGQPLVIRDVLKQLLLRDPRVADNGVDRAKAFARRFYGVFHRVSVRAVRAERERTRFRRQRFRLVATRGIRERCQSPRLRKGADAGSADAARAAGNKYRTHQIATVCCASNRHWLRSLCFARPSSMSMSVTMLASEMMTRLVLPSLRARTAA